MRQGRDVDVQWRALANFDCPAVDPLLGHADPALPLITCSADGTEKYLLEPVAMAGGDLEKAVAGLSTGGGGSTITVTFTDAGATRWTDLTTRSVGRSVAILADDVVLIAPQIRASITGGAIEISGRWTLDEAQALAALITGG